MKKLLRGIAALGLLALAIAPFGPGTGPAAAQEPDFDVPNGRFYTQTAGPGAGGPRGFGVVDDAEARFYSEFRRLGEVQGVGYPISRRFIWDGFVSQAFQRGVLQWRSEIDQVYFVNVFDLMSQAEQDPFLLTVRQVPGIADWSSDTGKPFDQVIAAHQALLDANPAIKAAYFAVPDPINLYGLPMAPIADLGNVFVLRAQRVVIQQWKENVPWAAAGQVTVANGGDVAKEVGLLPAGILEPVVYAAGVQLGGPTQPATPAVPALPPASPTAQPALPAATPTAAPAPAGTRPPQNPKELKVTAALDPGSTSPGRVRLNATVTDEAGRPIWGAIVAVIVEYPEIEFADFTPNTDAQGKSAMDIPVPGGLGGRSIKVRVTAIYAELGTTIETSFTPR